jgi:hypothetical protein
MELYVLKSFAAHTVSKLAEEYPNDNPFKRMMRTLGRASSKGPLKRLTDSSPAVIKYRRKAQKEKSRGLLRKYLDAEQGLLSRASEMGVHRLGDGVYAMDPEKFRRAQDRVRRKGHA